ncbi:MAG: metallophosphoesterase family protein [Candidatus Helarchaeota archaeon]|nr:metallophosphoesterase family protein [Candidatus Helarchaeota archaeon]
MILGFLSDAHGNPFGFSDCLKLLLSRGAEKIYFLGDAVGYLPHDLKVLENLIQHEIPCVMGNHEAMATGLLPIPQGRDEIYRLRSTVSSLPGKIKKEISLWQNKKELEIDGKKILLIHGRPSNCLEGYLYGDGEILSDEDNGFDVIVMGHTHRPFIRQEKGALWLNAGSCGLPRDIGNSASCLIYDSIVHRAEILRAEIDADELLSSCPAGSVATDVISILKRR